MAGELATSGTGAVLDTLVLSLLGLVGVLATTYGIWKLGKRNTSGTTATSDAAVLWTEGASLRTELRTEIMGLRTQLSEAVIRIRDLVEQIAVANYALAQAREETRLSREQTSKLIADVATVYAEIKTGNSLTMATLADNAESRRILLIPEADRTDAERTHLATVGILGHTGGERI